MSYTYAYLVLNLIMGVIWLFLFLARKDLRHHMISSSLITAPLGLTQYWFYQDYWRPEYLFPISLHGIPLGAEDVIFSFFIGGICGLVYEIIFRKSYQGGKKRTAASLGIAVLGTIMFLIFWHLGFSSILASALGAILISLLMIYIDNDLSADGIISAALMFIVVFVIYQSWLLFFPSAFSKFWLPSGLSGNQFLGIPFEEFIWYASWGMFGGIFYEFWINAGPYENLPRTIKSRPGI